MRVGGVKGVKGVVEVEEVVEVVEVGSDNGQVGKAQDAAVGAHGNDGNDGNERRQWLEVFCTDTFTPMFFSTNRRAAAVVGVFLCITACFAAAASQLGTSDKDFRAVREICIVMLVVQVLVV